MERIPPLSVDAIGPRISRPHHARPRAVRGDLRAGIGDGAACSVMVGIGETYLPAFALAVGCGEVASGLVSTLPLLLGGALQLAAPYGVRRFGSYRRWVVLLAACQGLSFVPLLVAALLGAVPSGLVFLCATIYWAAGLSTGPAWNTWIGTLVPPSVRSSYFARRTVFTQAGILTGFVCGGIVLETGSAWGATLDAFAAVFLVASLCRAVSVWFLSRQSEPIGPAQHYRPVSWSELRRRLATRADAGFLLYFLGAQCAVQIAGPYFNPYMLQQLRLSYAHYMLLIAAAYVSRIIALPALGEIARRYGARRLLWVGGIGIAPLAGAWLISNSYPFLIVLQLIVGVFWAAYELSTFLLFFETIPAEERTSVLTTFNFAHATATATGSLLGGAALILLGKTPAAYLTLFAASSVARVAALALLWRVPSHQPATSLPPAVRLPIPSPAGAKGRPRAAAGRGIAA
jgi:MFS family permease